MQLVVFGFRLTTQQADLLDAQFAIKDHREAEINGLTLVRDQFKTGYHVLGKLLQRTDLTDALPVQEFGYPVSFLLNSGKHLTSEVSNYISRYEIAAYPSLYILNHHD
jgi:hypothetical protein